MGKAFLPYYKRLLAGEKTTGQIRKNFRTVFQSFSSQNFAALTVF
jgi:hypothetical protein